MNKSFIECSWGKAHIVHYQTESTSKLPIIALHGWLDNQTSFIPLSKHMDRDIYSIDLPGHGHSSHLADGSRYHFVDYIEKTYEVIEKLGLSNLHLMGHSLGAAIAALYTAIFPEKVESLILIDGLGPLVNDANQSPEVLRKAILDKKPKKKKRRISSIERATEIRQSVGELSQSSAQILVKGQLCEEEHGFIWTYDPKLTHTSSLRMSPEQLEAFYKRLKTPTLLIEASHGLLANYAYEHYLRDSRFVDILPIEGHHHLHMDSPEIVADAIKEFLS